MENIDKLENLAVEAAVNFNWALAIDSNKKIIRLDKKNLAAYLRLGFAASQIQKFADAIKYYRKALKLQPNNTIATENLERIKILQSKEAKNIKTTPISLDPDLFLETPGKTKSVSLVNIGQKNILAHLMVGQEVDLISKKRKVEIRTKENEYIGSLPDDLSRRLLIFLKAKSLYAVFIKEAGLNKITVFIREEKKGKKVQHYLSFPHNIQAKMEEVHNEKDGDEEHEEVGEGDIEKMAENLTSEEKEYLPYHQETTEEENEE